ncbi:unnamed protein product [Ceutorhynchus assimilis]|uniref:THAP-type domain-containing protein n=1 Tax=Ceutorhynchus assimilis TaxID=467358 RepID=A0A9N9MPD0_9CUCU|nr:unnamed protein product [Ceutorhynchus assimilis]
MECQRDRHPSHNVCSAKGCGNKSYLSGHSFFRFPKNPERARSWAVACNREDLLQKLHQLHVSHRLCQIHFEDKFYGPSKKKLVKTAVPTIFPSLVSGKKINILEQIVIKPDYFYKIQINVSVLLEHVRVSTLRARSWAVACNREDLLQKLHQLHVSHRLCQIHFEDKFYGPSKKKLVKTAVPTIFPSLVSGKKINILEQIVIKPDYFYKIQINVSVLLEHVRVSTLRYE